ncbi:MAG: LysR substrate-binding domain-containing protein, partial [Duganella sp.]
MDKLRSMAVLVAVVDTGNFTAAARACDMSPVMVGKHIASLESLLGARLLVRTTRRQRLTEIGAQYVEQCRTILDQITAAESGAEAMRGAPRGRLKITAPLVFGAEQLAPALTGYLRQQPDVSLDLHLNDRAVDLVDEGYDAAIRIGKLHDSSMVGRPLRDYAMLICASPAYLAAGGPPPPPAHQAPPPSPHRTPGAQGTPRPPQ